MAEKISDRRVDDTKIFKLSFALALIAGMIALAVCVSAGISKEFILAVLLPAIFLAYFVLVGLTVLFVHCTGYVPSFLRRTNA